MAGQDHGGEGLAPVVPLFGGAAPETPVARDASMGAVEDAERWHTTWRSADSAPVESVDSPGEDRGERDDAAERAEARLTRALASRSLSEREARDRLRREDVEPHDVDDIVDRLTRIGALDDDRLAEQLVHAALTRKNQGRRAIAQSLSKRGVSRESIDVALAELPDDDHERALEFARGKAPSLVRHDHDTALRRLVGQLSRRGFGGSLAMTVANQALDEARGGGVRFR